MVCCESWEQQHSRLFPGSENVSSEMPPYIKFLKGPLVILCYDPVLMIEIYISLGATVIRGFASRSSSTSYWRLIGCYLKGLSRGGLEQVLHYFFSVALLCSSPYFNVSYVWSFVEADERGLKFFMVNKILLHCEHYY